MDGRWLIVGSVCSRVGQRVGLCECRRRRYRELAAELLRRELWFDVLTEGNVPIDRFGEPLARRVLPFSLRSSALGHVGGALCGGEFGVSAFWRGRAGTFLEVFETSLDLLACERVLTATPQTRRLGLNTYGNCVGQFDSGSGVVRPSRRFWSSPRWDLHWH